MNGYRRSSVAKFPQYVKNGYRRPSVTDKIRRQRLKLKQIRGVSGTRLELNEAVNGPKTSTVPADDYTTAESPTKDDNQML